jgi:hypothetical protein
MALSKGDQRGVSTRVPFPSICIVGVHLRFMNMNGKPWKTGFFRTTEMVSRLPFGARMRRSRTPCGTPPHAR